MLRVIVVRDGSASWVDYETLCDAVDMLEVLEQVWAFHMGTTVYLVYADNGKDVASE